MTREEFTNLIKGMKAVYFAENFIKDQYSADMWYGLLQDIPYKLAAMALKNFMQTSSRLPTPADIRQGAYELAKGEDMTGLEAWGIVSKAIGNSGYNSEKEFGKLPPTIQKAVGSPRQLYMWSQTDSTSVETVIQSQFIRSYSAVVEREERMAKISPDILKIIKEASKSLEAEE